MLRILKRQRGVGSLLLNWDLQEGLEGVDGCQAGVCPILPTS